MAAKGLCNEHCKRRAQFLAAVLKDEIVGLLEQRDVSLEAVGEASLEICPVLTQILSGVLIQGS